MDYEKKYNELAGKIKKAYLYAQTDSTKAVLEDILPELKESEDERIRQSIIADIKSRLNNCTHTLDDYYREQIAWLEKQGKQKSTNKLEPKLKVKYACGEYNVVDEKEINGVTFYGIEDEPNHIDYVKADTCEIINAKPKFKVGDWIIRSNKAFKHNTYLIKEVKDYYVCEDLKGRRVPFSFDDVHKNFKLWDIADAKDGDVLTVNGRPFIYCCYDDYQGNYCCIDSNGEFRTTFDFGFNGKTILPATKEQRDTLERAITNAGYEWDDKNKKLKKIETKGGEE